MGDRTNIAVTQSHLTPKGAECGYVAVVPLAGGGWLCTKCGASGLRADPDTSDERKPCPHCNDEGMVCTLDGDIIGPCDCTSDELFAEARRLLDAATPGPWERPSSTANWFTVPQPIQIDEADWGQETQEGGAMCGYRIGTLADERAWRYADVELIAAAPRLIAALLERAVTAEADRGEAERRERTAVNLANYHRDVARTAGGRAEHAEAEARQLREAIEFTASALDFEIDGDKFPRSVRQSLLDQLAVIDAAVAEGAEE